MPTNAPTVADQTMHTDKQLREHQPEDNRDQGGYVAAIGHDSRTSQLTGGAGLPGCSPHAPSWACPIISRQPNTRVSAAAGAGASAAAEGDCSASDSAVTSAAYAS